jgi:hypothetical protein
MKILLAIIAVIIVIFILIQFFAMRGQKNIESYPYTVDKKYPNFEIRTYEASLFTSVKLSTKEYKTGSSKGFSILAGYIFGGNEKKEKIAMTSPVVMSMEDTMTMMFMVPKKYNKENLPKPNQSQIEFKEEPAKTVAAITFGGWANDKKISQYTEKLKSALEAAKIPYKNQFFFLGYNPPYEVFNRKNEIMIVLDDGVMKEIKE